MNPFPINSRNILIYCLLVVLSTGPLALLVVPAAQLEARKTQRRYLYHKVRKGENLSRIAKRYKTSIANLRKLNKLPRKGNLLAGRVIKVGYRKTAHRKSRQVAKNHKVARYYRVKRGDSLSRIAKKYRVSLRNLKRWNKIKRHNYLRIGQRLKIGEVAVVKRAPKIPEGTRWKKLSSQTRIKIPLNYTPARTQNITFKHKKYILRIFAGGFTQGHAAYLELMPTPPRNRKLKKQKRSAPQKFQINFLGKKIPLKKTNYGYRAIFALPPNKKPGRYPMILKVTQSGKTSRTRHFIAIKKTSYKTSIWRRNIGHPSKRKPMRPEIAEKIRRASKRKARIFAIFSADKFGNTLSHPRSLHKITSDFYTTRKTVRYYYHKRRRIYAKSQSRKHRGLDLRGRTGAPIYAMANGRVVAAERMHFEGNFTVIDHGNGIFSGYMHQSKFNIRAGKFVKAGQLIGKSGATGAVTGAHLHMSLWIRGVPVDPLSLLSLPIRR